MSSTRTLAPTEMLAAQYGEAWSTRDVEAILALHTADSVFQLHAPGYARAEGIDAVRESFAAVFALLPDVTFTSVRQRIGEDFWVLESLMQGTTAAGISISVDCVDVISVRDGLVASKDTYLDALAFQAQLTP